MTEPQKTDTEILKDVYQILEASLDSQKYKLQATASLLLNNFGHSPLGEKLKTLPQEVSTSSKEFDIWCLENFQAITRNLITKRKIDPIDPRVSSCQLFITEYMRREIQSKELQAGRHCVLLRSHGESGRYFCFGRIPNDTR